jgi:hypothetical protein
MFANTYTSIHSLISLFAILTGAFVVLGLFGARWPRMLTMLFLLLAVAASATGFGFPFNGVLPSHVVGVVALAVLAVTLLARFSAHYAGAWRWIYSTGVIVSLYLLVFVLVAQAFAKIPVLKNLAPTQSEPPFAIAQLAVLAVFAVLGLRAARAFRPEGAPQRERGYAG